MARRFAFPQVIVMLAATLLCLAARAGEITAYTALEEDDIKVYLDAFAKAKPGIKVNILRLSTGDLTARILAEKANPRHDVIWGVAVTQMVDPRILEMAEVYRRPGSTRSIRNSRIPRAAGSQPRATSRASASTTRS
jgi:iron(III) transport system substrate-binding protein